MIEKGIERDFPYLYLIVPYPPNRVPPRLQMLLQELEGLKMEQSTSTDLFMVTKTPAPPVNKAPRKL